jgi:hypothetical protein
MKEREFQAWLNNRYKPGTVQTYLSDLRRIERRFSGLHDLCLNGGIDDVISQIRKSGELGENKSYNAEIQAIRTYLRFLDDYLCGQSNDVDDAPLADVINEVVDAAPKNMESYFNAQVEPRNTLSYSGGFWHPDIFPREAFVQRNIQSYFSHLGFQQVKGGSADWVCHYPESGQRWHVECKGLTTAVGLDFRTGLGQLMQAMQLDDTNYAMAVPNIPAFLHQIERMNSEFVTHIGLQFLLVDPSGGITKYFNDR